MTPQRDALFKLTDCYENISKAGNRYYVGYLGAVKLVMLPRKDARDGEPAMVAVRGGASAEGHGSVK